MSARFAAHVSSDRLGEAAQHASLDGLRDVERLHVEGCDQCRQLYAGYRLTDRLLAASWRQTMLPPSALVEKPIRAGLLGFLDGFALSLSPRSLAPVALALCLAAVVGFGVLLPQLMPISSPAAGSPSTPAQVSSSPSAASAGPTAGGSVASAGPVQSPRGPGTSPGGHPNPGKSAAPTGQSPVSMASLSGWPVAWAPDGAHLMVAGSSGWTKARQIAVRDPSGRATGSFDADSATWVDSRTIATATAGKGPGDSATVRLVSVNGHVTATLPGQYSEGGKGSSGAILLGSGTGELAIASQGGWGPSGSSFVIWNGQSTGSSHQGMPIAFSRDGNTLAVLHPSGGPGGGSSGWLEIVSVPGLNTVASFSHTTIRIPPAGDGPGYAPDAAFSPDGHWLYDAGTLVDLSRGSTVRVGDGGWLADGTLLTSNGGAVLRWHGSSSAPDGRFQAGGSVATSRRGDAIEFFGDGRAALLLPAGGTVRQLKLPGIASVDDAQFAPNGGAIAISGRGTGGDRVFELARLK